MRRIWFILFLLILGSSGSNAYYGEGLCGPNSSPSKEVYNLIPCQVPAEDEGAPVSPECCKIVEYMIPDCFCAAVHCEVAKKVGFKIKAQLTIPIRCHFNPKSLEAFKCQGWKPEDPDD